MTSDAAAFLKMFIPVFSSVTHRTFFIGLFIRMTLSILLHFRQGRRLQCYFPASCGKKKNKRKRKEKYIFFRGKCVRYKVIQCRIWPDLFVFILFFFRWALKRCCQECGTPSPRSSGFHGNIREDLPLMGWGDRKETGSSHPSMCQKTPEDPSLTCSSEWVTCLHPFFEDHPFVFDVRHHYKTFRQNMF